PEHVPADGPAHVPAQSDNFGALPRVGEQLEQQRVLDPPVDDVRARDAAVDRLEARRQLGPHPAGDSGIGKRPLYLVRGSLRDHALRVGGIPQPTRHVGQEDDLVGPQGRGDGAGRLVGVDVVRMAVAVGPDARDHGDVVAGDVGEYVHVHALDAPDEADVLTAGRRLAAHPEKQTVVSAEPDGGLAVATQAQDDVLVDLADEDHLCDLDSLGVGYPKPLDKPYGEVEPLHVGGDVWAAAVDDDRVHADVGEQDDVACELLPQPRVGHGRTAVLDHDGPAVELADVGQRLEKSPDVSQVVYSELRWTYSFERSEKNTSVSPPLPGSVSAYSTSLPCTRPSSSVSSLTIASPPETTRRPSISRSATIPEPGGQTIPAAWRIRPKLGSAPWSAVFTSGE